MIIECPECSTRFKLDPARIKAESVGVRCSRCKHIFTVSRPQEVLQEELVHVPPQEAESAPTPSPKTSRRLLLFLIPVLVIAAGIALWLYLPWPVLRHSGSESTGIELLHLVETRGYFFDNPQAGQLFVIEGRVRNDYPTPRRWIRLRAKLYNADGSEAMQLVFYAGNLLTEQQLRTLDPAEQLRLIQELPQEPRQHIAAGQEVSFIVSFGNLPELSKLSDYSVEIVESQPT